MALPARVLSTERDAVLVDLGGRRQRASSLLPGLDPGEWVLISAGMILERISEQQALEVQAVLDELQRSA